MDINITIFFQAIQFFIAYFFLYKCLFAPAYHILQEQECYEKKLHNQLEQECATKKTLQKDFALQCSTLKALLIDMIPTQVLKLKYQKLKANVTLYHIKKIEIAPKSVEVIETELVDNLSQVIK